MESLKAKLIKPEKKEDLDFNPVRPTPLLATRVQRRTATTPAPAARTVQRTFPIIYTHGPLPPLPDCRVDVLRSAVGRVSLRASGRAVYILQRY